MASSVACGAMSVATLFRALIDATAHAGLDFRFLLDAYERVPFLQGIVVSIEIVVSTMLGSALAGVLLLLALRGGNRWIAGGARAFVELTRNTPTLVQLYCAFLVLNMLISEALRPYANPLTPFIWVVSVVSLHKAAFHAEALRAGIDAVPQMTLEAAASLGFSRKQQL